jgi:pimeloyl-ACP methyl ester carboxylesterase
LKQWITLGAQLRSEHRPWFSADNDGTEQGACHVRIARRIVVTLVILVAALIVAALSYRAWQQYSIARATRISSPSGIDVAKFIDVNGMREWITIRSENRDNPVILFLHGGPGEANSPFAKLYRPYEKNFVFVQWDQPGAGRTYTAAGDHQPALTLESMTADGIAVAKYVSLELHKPKIILMGTEWGSLLGLRMIKQQPDLFAAFVGTGQIVSMLTTQQWQYVYTRDRASTGHDQQTLNALSAIGPPPYRTLEGYRRFGDYFIKYWGADDLAAVSTLQAQIGNSPSLSLIDVYRYVVALRRSEALLYGVQLQEDLLDQGGSFSVPLYFIQGENDPFTPTSLVAEFVTKVEAPVKSLHVIPGASHFVIWQHPADFLHYLLRDVATASVPTDAAN